MGAGAFRGPTGCSPTLASPRHRPGSVRRGEVPAVVGRVEHGQLLLDLRSVPPEDDERLITAISAAVGAVP